MREDRARMERLRQEAAEWCITMADGKATRTTKARFAEWITLSPQHLREYASVEALWEEAARYGDALRQNEDVIPLFPRCARSAEEDAQGRPVSPSRRRAIAGLSGLAATALLAAVGWWAGLVDADFGLDREVYETRTGENRLISLADNSFVHLNTDSRLVVDYDPDGRYLELERGEAFFEVEKDPNRPFVVAAGDAEVRAVGTAFNVKSVESDFSVTVVEGEVLVSGQPEAVDSGATEPWRKSLTANKQLRIDRRVPKATVEEYVVAAEAITSWRQNKLTFADAPLADVVADFNRYNRRHIEIIDSELAALKVSGVFDPRDPEAFAETMTALADIAVISRPDSRILLRAKHR